MENNTLDKLIQKDAECILHPASSITALLENGPQMVQSATGCHLVDAEGRRLLDAIAGLWCVNVGYGRQELSSAMKRAADQLAYYHTFSNASNPWQVVLAEKLCALAPDNINKVFYGSSGSDANDTIIKIAWQYHALRGNPTKTKIISRHQSYHGTSISTAGLTGLGNFHKALPLPLDFIVHVECPHFYTRAQSGESEAEFCERLIADVAATIENEGANNIAAFFAEPIQAAGGIIEPPAGYYEKLKKLLQQNDILLVADEVVCGFGRLGSWFGSTLLGFEPDMISGAKGLTSGYFPMSVAMMTDEIWQVLKQGSETLGGFFHGYTYSGHPVGAAVALANLEIIENENLVERAAIQGQTLHRRLHETFDQHPRVGEIRGRGLLAGVQLVEDKASRRVVDPALKLPLNVSNRARELGVIVRPLPSVGSIAISPPFIFSDEHIETLVEVLHTSINAID